MICPGDPLFVADDMKKSVSNGHCPLAVSITRLKNVWPGGRIRFFLRALPSAAVVVVFLLFLPLPHPPPSRAFCRLKRRPALRVRKQPVFGSPQCVNTKAIFHCAITRNVLISPTSFPVVNLIRYNNTGRNLIIPVFMKEINLLLLVKTVNGKSATGDSILGQRKFISKDSCESVTRQVDYEVVEFENRRIKACDGPGIGDTHYIDDVKKAKKVVMDTMKNAVLLNPDGYHAFLFVIKNGNRLTLEERECIRILKAIYGDDFIKNNFYRRRRISNEQIGNWKKSLKHGV
ncbi:GTPase IMAP member 9 [Bulinus truncatus]|nr:GTPase IMAP member 9 [Bulinus truncatus]